MSCEGDDDVVLNDVWTMYFHDPNDSDWTCNSYKRITNISSVKEYWRLHDLLKAHIPQGMFFFMREHVFPCWDDPNNIDGGCLSIKVLKQHMPAFWHALCVRLLGETLCEDVGDWHLVRGISTSPKRNFCIVKLWIGDDAHRDPAGFALPTMHAGEILYKSNRENMESNQRPEKCSKQYGSGGCGTTSGT